MYHINKTRGKCCTECKQTILLKLSWEEGNEKGGIITKKVKKNPSINLIEKMVDKSTTCGLFGWRPQWAQRFADRRIYMLLFSIIGIVQSMAFSYLTVVLSTIEKRFGLKSKEATWIYSGNEISQIFFILFLPFVGRVQRRPLFMGLSIMLSAVGLLIITLPHFTGEKTYLQINGAQNESYYQNQVCDSENIRIKEGECDGTSDKDWASLVVVFLGIFLLGFGVSFYFSFGIPFIDDNTDRSNSPFSLSIVFSARIIGPTLGFMLASTCLSMYVDPDQVPDGIANEDHPRWIGAWWIGFLVIAALLMLFAPWLILFPARLPVPTGSKSQNNDASKVEKELTEDKQPETMKEWWTELMNVVKRLASSKVYVLQTISFTCFLFGIMGFATFMPKFIEYHYRKRASTSGYSGGISKTVSSVIGLLVSGWIMGRWRFKARTLAKWCVFADILAIIGVCSISIFSCPPSHFPNVETDSRSSIIMSACNEDCGCKGIPYNPICSNEDRLTNYFSPCHAGCKNFEVDENGTIAYYTNCACIKNAELAPGALPPPLSIDASGVPVARNLTATVGVCPVDCNSKFYALLGFLFLFSMVGSTTRVPNFLLSLRSIDLRDKSASLTFQVSFLSLFAFLPSPMIYGAILDTTCNLWDTTKCGETTHCLMYDTDAMRNYLAFIPAAFIFLATLCDIGVYYYAKDLTIYEDDTDENDYDGSTIDGGHELGDTKSFKEVDLN